MDELPTSSRPARGRKIKGKQWSRLSGDSLDEGQDGQTPPMTLPKPVSSAPTRGPAGRAIVGLSCAALLLACVSFVSGLAVGLLHNACNSTASLLADGSFPLNCPWLVRVD